jgi:hypothetical protein
MASTVFERISSQDESLVAVEVSSPSNLSSLPVPKLETYSRGLLWSPEPWDVPTNT